MALAIKASLKMEKETDTECGSHF